MAKLNIYYRVMDVEPFYVKLVRDANHWGEWFWYYVRLKKNQKAVPLIGYEERENGKWRVYNVRKSEYNLGGWIGEYDTKEMAIAVAKCRLFEEVAYLTGSQRNWMALQIGFDYITDNGYLDLLVDIGERDDEKYNINPLDIEGLKSA